MSFAILAALGISFGYAVLQRGGVGWADWSLTLLAVGILGILHFLWNLRPSPTAEKLPALDRFAGFSAAAFLVFVAIQIAPLPISLVRHLSPKRVELQQAALPFVSTSSQRLSPDRVTLSAVPRATAEYLLTTSFYALLF